MPPVTSPPPDNKRKVDDESDVGQADRKKSRVDDGRGEGPAEKSSRDEGRDGRDRDDIKNRDIDRSRGRGDRGDRGERDGRRDRDRRRGDHRRDDRRQQYDDRERRPLDPEEAKAALLSKEQRTIFVEQLTQKTEERDIRRYFKRKAGR